MARIHDPKRARMASFAARGQVLAACPWGEVRALDDGAHIYLFEEIGFWGTTASDFVEQFNQIDDDEQITVHINSPGGSVADATVMYNYLREHSGQVNVVIEGFAMSAASFIAMAGDRVAAYKTSMVMIHSPSAFVIGTADDMRAVADSLDDMANAMIGAYTRGGQIDEATVKGWFNGDNYFIAEAAKDAGLIDEVRGAEEADEGTSAYHSRVLESIGTWNIRDPAMEQMIAAIASASKSDPAATGQPPAPTPAPDPSATGQPPAPTPAPDPSATGPAAEAAMHIERQRISAIDALFQANPGHEEIRAKAIADGVTLDAARDLLLKAIGEKTLQQTARVTVVADYRDKFIEGCANAIMLRAGMIEGRDEQNAARDGNQFMSFSLFDMARHSVMQFHGEQYAMGSRLDIVAEAFTRGSDDFDKLLENVARKALYLGYEETPEVYRQLSRIVNLADFKQMKFVAFSSFSNLDEVPELGEYKFGDFKDAGESVVLTTYGKLFGLSRQAIINDDLNQFTRIPASMGRAGARKIGDLFSAVFTANAKLEQTNKTLFHADHRNIATNLPSTAAMDAMNVAMGTQKDLNNNRIQIRPWAIYCPVALESKFRLINMNERTVGEGADGDTTDSNTARGMVTEIVSDARLDDDSASGWYGMGNPNLYDTVAIALLDGRDEPYFERQDMFDRDGVTWKVRVDAAAAALDFRAVYRGNE